MLWHKILSSLVPDFTRLFENSSDLYTYTHKYTHYYKVTLLSNVMIYWNIQIYIVFTTKKMILGEHFTLTVVYIWTENINI